MFAKKIDSSINMAVVSEWRKRYLERSAAKPDFYHTGEHAITVGLPLELINFSNASGGHSGFESGARPTGIRYSVEDPQKTLDEIFESDESLALFISGSDCSGPEHCARELREYQIKKGIITVDPLDRPIAESNLETLYGRGTIARMQQRYPKTALHDYRVLTRREFEARYDIHAVDQSAAV